MNIEVIPSPVYLLEGGIPSYKAGEWEGIKPNHFGRTRLLLKQIRKNENPPNKFSHKRTIHKSSSEYIFRPSKKQVKSYLENINKRNNLKSGRKYIHPDYYKKFHKISKFFRVNPPRDNPATSNSIILPKISIKNDISHMDKKVSFSTSCETNVESMMNKKKRIYSLEQQRNYYKEVNPGDKNYRYAEHSTDFFKEGGLIVGSTNKIRITDNYNKLKNNIYQTMDLNIKSLDNDKLWKSKVQKEKEKNEIEYVLNLEQWEKRYCKIDETKNNKDKSKTKGKEKIIEKPKKKVKIK